MLAYNAPAFAAGRGRMLAVASSGAAPGPQAASLRMQVDWG